MLSGMNAETRYTDLPDEKPAAPPKGGIYRPVLVAGHLVWVSGHGPMLPDGTWIQGKVGEDLDLVRAKEAARVTGLGILATLRAELGGLDRIEQVVKILGMVNATPDFDKQPQVINGCSELFAEVFGEEKGVGVRSAVGMGSLPAGIAVEIEAVFELAAS